MGEVLPLPHRGETFLDPRGEGRSIRLSGHRGAATIVLSIWQHGECRATFRLAGSEVDGFIRALLSAAPPSAPTESAVPDAERLRSVVAEFPLSDDDGPVTTVGVVPVPAAEATPSETASADPAEPADTQGPTSAGDGPAGGPGVEPAAGPGAESIS